jgi:hypothetical protein
MWQHRWRLLAIFALIFAPAILAGVVALLK